MAHGDDRGEDVGQALVTSIRGMTETLADHTETVGSLRERLASQEQSTKSLWHEVRGIGDKIDRKFDALPASVEGAVKAHAEECIARERARKRATNGNSHAPPPPTGYHRGEDSQVVSVVSQGSGGESTADAAITVPRPVLWIGIGVGVAIAISGWILSMLGVLPSIK